MYLCTLKSQKRNHGIDQTIRKKEPMESNEGKIDETVERKYHYKEERTEYINQEDAQTRRGEGKKGRRFTGA
mgnify:FL=1